MRNALFLASAIFLGAAGQPQSASDPIETYKNIVMHPGNITSRYQRQVIHSAVEQIPAFLASKEHEEGGHSEQQLIEALNALHGFSDETIRFQSLSKANGANFYQLITKSNSYYYTSTFNYLYKEFGRRLAAEPEGFSGFLAKDAVREERLPEFFDALSTFGKFGDFNHRIGLKDRQMVMRTLLRRLDESALATIAAANFSDNIEEGDTALAEEFENLLASGYASAKTLRAKDCYGVLASWYARHHNIEASPQRDFLDKMAGIPRYRIDLPQRIEEKEIFDVKRRHLQAETFFADEDGYANYQSFVDLLKRNGWTRIKDTPLFASYTKSWQGRTIISYLTKPLTGGIKKQMEAIRADAATLHGVITDIKHHGHSFTMPQTIAEIDNNTVLLFGGACGGTQFIQQALFRNGHLQLDLTGDMGKRTNTEARIMMQNEFMLTKGNIVWSDFEVAFSAVKQKEMQYYVTPSRNIAAGIISRFIEFSDHSAHPLLQPAPHL